MLSKSQLQRSQQCLGIGRSLRVSHERAVEHSDPIPTQGSSLIVSFALFACKKEREKERQRERERETKNTERGRRPGQTKQKNKKNKKKTGCCSAAPPSCSECTKPLHSQSLANFVANFHSQGISAARMIFLQFCLHSHSQSLANSFATLHSQFLFV